MAAARDVLDLHLPSGRVRAERLGDAEAPLVLCVHGLSANLRAFDVLGSRLAADGSRQVVALDLRGRGRSERTAAGTYGLDAHARDVLDLSLLLGAEHVDLVGWSMGALVGIVAAAQAPARVRRLALIDHAGRMDAAALVGVQRALARLDVEVRDPAHYVNGVRSAGGLTQWEPLWDDYFRYELERTRTGWSPSTSRAACEEDVAKADFDAVRALWPRLQLPTLLVRSTVPLAGGFVVPPSERDALVAAVPQARVVEVDRDHYGVLTARETAAAVGSLLAADAASSVTA